MQKILIVKVSSLGDVVHTLPVVADIHRHHPNAQIDWLVEEGFADLVRLVVGVQRVISFSLRRWRKQLFTLSTWREMADLRRLLASERYDAVIDCQGLIKTAWLGSWARGPLIGLGNRTDGSSYEWPVRFFYQQRVKIAARTHVIERSRQLVSAALDGALPTLATLDFGLNKQLAIAALATANFQCDQPYVVFVHATSRLDKQWPLACWVELGRTLIQQGKSIVLPWGNQAERAVSEQIASACGAAAQVPPRLTLAAIVGLMEQAVGVVGVDTGLVHIAAALNRPTIELYNFDTAWRTGGYWSPCVVNLGGADQPLQLEEVKQALRGLGLLEMGDT